MDKPKYASSQQAREAAALGRQRRAELRQRRAEENTEVIAVFVVRGVEGYTWEVRRFGGLVVAQGDQCFVTAEEARAAGQATLDWLVGSGWTAPS